MGGHMEIGKRGIWILSGIVAIALFAVGFVVGIVVDPGISEDAVTRNELVELEQRLVSTLQANTEPGTVDPQAGPWPYVPLDVEHVRKLGHEGHHEGSCGYGSFDAVVSALQEEIGYPYDQIPTYMLHFGRGGVSGSGDVCGAVLGSLSAINLVAGEEYRPLAAELIAYYRETPFPTDAANDYAVSHAYYVEDYLDEQLGQTAAGDIACAVSRGTWVEETGYEMGSAEREERCARLTGDVAAKAVQILNAWYAERTSEGSILENPDEELSVLYPNAEFSPEDPNVYRVAREGETVGYAGVGSDLGHEGTIVLAVGVGLDGSIDGVHVIEQNETTGLGDVIATEGFLQQFEGLSPADCRLASDDGAIEAVSGATVSCKSAVGIVRSCVERVETYVAGAN
jgi:hypothetical protein